MKLDLKEWLAKVTGQAEYKTLLWTNSDPYATFAAQTVINNTDLTIYDSFQIFVQASRSNVQSGYANVVTRGATGTTGTWVTGSAPSMNDSWLGIRKVKITDTSIEFGNGGYYYVTGAGNNLNHNDYGIPLKIYGIKYIGQ